MIASIRPRALGRIARTFTISSGEVDPLSWTPNFFATARRMWMDGTEFQWSANKAAA
jgi:hypothetical protein